jgi:hypothetical protein
MGWAAAAITVYAWAFMWHWRNPVESPKIVGYPGLFLWYAEPGEHWYKQIVSSWYLWCFLGILSCASLFLRERGQQCPISAVQERPDTAVASER